MPYPTDHPLDGSGAARAHPEISQEAARAMLAALEGMLKGFVDDTVPDDVALAHYGALNWHRIRDARTAIAQAEGRT
jgi:hypothetical protein